MRYQLHIDRNYLRFPIRVTEEEREVSIWSGDGKQYQFTMALFTGENPEECDFFGELPVSHLKGQEIQIEIEPEVSSFAPQLSDELLQQKPEQYPYLHFAPKSGWMNDPNGLCFYGGEYHLFFQHNMFNTKWNNISWGHAVSRDLLHWKQLEDALLPDALGAMYSGCAFVQEDELLLFYTHAGGRTNWSEGKKFTQRIARSRDGRTFVKDAEPIIPNLVYENRDPKVYRYEDSDSYYMVLFLDGHEYAIFNSDDLEHWEQTQTLTIEESWECPDLVALPVAGAENEKRSVFWTPDGYYYVGTFDGRIFTRTQEPKRIYGDVKEKRTAYAAQTFWGTEGRTVQLPWMTKVKVDGLYSGVMGLPRELELIPDGDEYLLAAHLIREIDEQEMRLWDRELTPEDGTVQETWTDDGAALLKLVPKDSASFSLEFGGIKADWDSEAQKLSIEGLQPIEMKRMEDMQLVADKGIMEIGCNRDTISFFVNIDLQYPKELQIAGELQASFGIVR